jgi:hypothetical protein
MKQQKSGINEKTRAIVLVAVIPLITLETWAYFAMSGTTTFYKCALLKAGSYVL